MYFARNAFAYAENGWCHVVIALINSVFAPATHDAIVSQWVAVQRQERGRFANPAASKGAPFVGDSVIENKAQVTWNFLRKKR